MQMSGNTILITGGGSGIGRALAEAFHALGNQVIIDGRRQQVLEETIAANSGMKSAVFDIENSLCANASHGSKAGERSQRYAFGGVHCRDREYPEELARCY
jgi:NAD(P)-dependent dehydrogenase (short-subunit alcohol dehydrogenase family)